MYRTSITLGSREPRPFLVLSFTSYGTFPSLISPACLFSMFQPLHTALLGHAVLFRLSVSQLWMRPSLPLENPSGAYFNSHLYEKVPQFPCQNEPHPAVGNLNAICNLIPATQGYLCLSISSSILEGRDHLIFVPSELSNIEKRSVKVCEIKDKSMKGLPTN